MVSQDMIYDRCKARSLGRGFVSRDQREQSGCRICEKSVARSIIRPIGLSSGGASEAREDLRSRRSSLGGPGLRSKVYRRERAASASNRRTHSARAAPFCSKSICRAQSINFGTSQVASGSSPKKRAVPPRTSIPGLPNSNRQRYTARRLRVTRLPSGERGHRAPDDRQSTEQKIIDHSTNTSETLKISFYFLVNFILLSLFFWSTNRI